MVDDLEEAGGLPPSLRRLRTCRVARFDERSVDRLLHAPGIVRNRMKIASAIANARATLAVQEEFGSLDVYLCDFVGGSPKQNRWRSLAEIPAQTPESVG